MRKEKEKITITKEKLENKISDARFNSSIKWGLIGILIGVFGHKGCDAILDHSNYTPKGITIGKSIGVESEREVYVKSGANIHKEKLYQIYYPNGIRLQFTLDKKNGQIENYLIDITEKDAEKEAKYWREKMNQQMDNKIKIRYE
ncbi:MAG: hypothetical protein ACP5NV_01415 [Candidatus Woesearchaeota archaeon]